MSTDTIIQYLLSIRERLFIWNESLEEIDALLLHMDYEVASLPQYSVR